MLIRNSQLDTEKGPQRKVKSFIFIRVADGILWNKRLTKNKTIYQDSTPAEWHIWNMDPSDIVSIKSYLPNFGLGE